MFPQAELIYFLTAVFFLYGLMFGSFFNVLIYRLPVGKSIIFPSSHCPVCNHKLSWGENIPILSFLLLGGKCKGCKTDISIQYPIVELATGIYSILLFSLFLPQIQPNWQNWIILLFQYFTLLLFIPLAIIDIKHYIIPDELTISGIIISLLISFLPNGITPLQSIIGALSGGGFLFLVALIGKFILKKEAMGGGDIKFMLWIGALFGFEIALASIFIASVIGTVICNILIVAKKTESGNNIPFCPYLCAGILVAVVFSEKVLLFFSLN